MQRPPVESCSRASFMKREYGLESSRPRGVATAFVMLVLIALPNCDFVGPETSRGPSGRIVWRVDEQGWNFVPAFDGTAAYFGTRDHHVVAVEKATGRVLWKSATGTPGTDLYGRNLVVAGSVVAIADYRIVAFDRVTGQLAWMSERPPDNDAVGSLYLSTDGETIYSGTELARVYATDARTGRLKWSTQLPLRPEGVKAFSPIVVNNRVFVCERHFGSPLDGRLVALDATTGLQLWAHDFEPATATQFAGCGPVNAAIYASSVIADNGDGRILALDQGTGNILWIAPALAGLPNLPSSLTYGDDRPIAVSGHVVAAGSTSGYLTGYDARTGAQMWQVYPWIGSIALTRMSSDETTFYVRSIGGQIAAFDAQTGREEWRISGSRFLNGPAVDTDLLYAAGDAAYALDK